MVRHLSINRFHICFIVPTDADKNTPLFFSAEGGHLPCVAVLMVNKWIHWGDTLAAEDVEKLNLENLWESWYVPLWYILAILSVRFQPWHEYIFFIKKRCFCHTMYKIKVHVTTCGVLNLLLYFLKQERNADVTAVNNVSALSSLDFMNTQHFTV